MLFSILIAAKREIYPSIKKCQHKNLVQAIYILKGHIKGHTPKYLVRTCHGNKHSVKLSIFCQLLYTSVMVPSTFNHFIFLFGINVLIGFAMGTSPRKTQVGCLDCPMFSMSPLIPILAWFISLLRKPQRHQLSLFFSLEYSLGMKYVSEKASSI